MEDKKLQGICCDEFIKDKKNIKNQICSFILDLSHEELFSVYKDSEMNKNDFKNHLKYLMQNIDDFYLYVYKYIMSVDSKKEMKLLKNKNVEMYILIIKVYIQYMKYKSAEPNKKQMMVVLFTEYFNYSMYLLENRFNTKIKKIHNKESEFLYEINHALNKLNLNMIEEAIDIMENAAEKFELMTMPIRYYIQNLRNENNIYSHKLSICMIVKNETKYFEKCLTSIKPLIESDTAELIIVDTGSTDDTVEIAKLFTKKIYFHSWNNDFSEARNYSISIAGGQYFFVLDADEQLEKGESEKLIEFFNSEEYKKYKTFTLIEKNYADEEYNKFSSIFTRNFIFKNEKSFYYTGTIHEQPVFKYSIKNLNIKLVHYGYIMTDDIKDKKFTRTVTLLKKELEKSPNNVFYRHHLSGSFSMHGDTQEALDQVETYMAQIKKTKYNLQENFNLMYYNNAAFIYLVSGKYNETIEVCDEALAKREDFIDFIYYKALSLFKKREYEKSIVYLKKYLNLIEEIFEHEIINDTRYLFYSIDSKDTVLRVLLICYYKLEYYDKCITLFNEINDKNVIKNSLYIFIKCYLKTHECEKLQHLYIEKIKALNDDKIENLFDYLYCSIINDLEKNEENKKYQYLCNYDFEIDNIKNNYIKETLNFIEIFDIENYDKDGIDIINDKMIFRTIVPILDEYEIIAKSDQNELNILKKSCQFILDKSLNVKEFRVLSKEKLFQIFNKYISIISILASNSNDLISKKERKFILNFNKAFKEIELGNLLNAIRLIKEAVTSHNKMARASELYLEKIIPEYKLKFNYKCEKEYCSKENIQKLIDDGKLEVADKILKEYEAYFPNDVDIYSMKAAIRIAEDDFKGVEEILKSGLSKRNDNLDLFCNMGYVYECTGRYSEAKEMYEKAKELCSNEDLVFKIEQTILSLKN